MTLTSNRKLEHIDIVRRGGVEPERSTLLEYVRIVHRSLPEVDLDGIDLSVEFCGHELGAPLIITGMTGGHPDAEPINAAIAKAAEKFNIAMGVGSQRAALEDPSLIHTFSVVRERAPHAFIVANLGGAQLVKGYGVKEALKAIEMIRADAIAIHLNVGQELFQDEGDTRFEGILQIAGDLADELAVPVIVKEVGTGLSAEDVSLLRSIGVKCFDVAGLGGTNWIKIEALRSRAKHGYPLRDPGSIAEQWGNPTAVSIVEARSAAPDAYIIGSGGLRDGLDVAKAIALGADIGGFAAPALRALSSGQEGLERYLADVLYQLKSVLVMTGARRPHDLWSASVTVWGELMEELKVRNVDVTSYLNSRVMTLLWRRRSSGI
ncbi:MAG: type 2 isopentenyl-diphosphate Delta-isomerase [Acidilobus sp.]